jgi:hypothetical protein
MARKVKCPHCGEKVTILSRLRLGDRARCTECQRTFEPPLGTGSKLLQMLKVTLAVLVLVGVLALLHWLLDLNPSHWFANW